MDSTESPYKISYERERKARRQAERLLEDKSRELYLKNQQLEDSYQKLQKQQAFMVQSEKLATLGTLSAGVAHEINNPLAYVLSNMESLLIYNKSYQRLFEANRVWLKDEDLSEALRGSVETLIEEEDLDYVSDDLSGLLDDTIDGVKRVKDIVVNLGSFSRSQGSDRVETNLLDGLNSTLKLLSSQLKHAVTLELALQPLLPTVCNPNQLNQVFLNLIMNAKQATEGRDRPTVKVSSECDGETIIIRIQDNGYGMSEAVKKEIFVPFFTTKPIGKGTGMGLAISYGIIADHKGKIVVVSEEGVGTTFEVQIPIERG